MSRQTVGHALLKTPPICLFRFPGQKAVRLAGAGRCEEVGTISSAVFTIKQAPFGPLYSTMEKREKQSDKSKIWRKWLYAYL